MTTLTEPGPRAAYDDLALAYDHLTAHHRQEEWLATIEGLARHHGLSGTRQFDVACGTGKSFISFLERGYDVTACDLSPAMLEVARLKAGPRATLFVADMRDLPAAGAFDLVTCLDDSLNYLRTRDDLTRALAGFAANLAPRGIAVFDVNTLTAYRGVFARDECWESNGCFFAWRGQARTDEPADCDAEAIVEAFVPNGAAWHRVTTHHRQHHFPHGLVEGVLAQAGLECLAVYGHQPDGTTTCDFDEHRDTKRIYVATRLP